MPGNKEFHRILSGMLRVNHSGEFGANTIYKAQLRVLGQGDSEIKEMERQEIRHLKVFERILPTTRTRPSLLLPIWGSLGTVLGYSTALMSRQKAMVCTEAVETVITNHYNDQIRELLEIKGTLSQDEQLQADKLINAIKEFRDEEEEHKQIAMESTTASASDRILGEIIKQGCRAAIKIAKVI